MPVDSHNRTRKEQPAIRWVASTGVPTLAADEVHVWRAALPPAQEILPLSRLLSREEHDRAARFQQRADGHRFIGGRALLRMLLARYLHTEPEALLFTYGLHGKPDVLGEDRLGCNIAHSGNLMLISVASTKSVGVDVEQVRDGVDITQVAKYVYSPLEQVVAASLPLAKRREAFFNCWTRKEAWLKACGAGLTIDPTTFGVPLGPVSSFEIVNPEADGSAPNRWTVWAINPGDGYKGAVAVLGTGWKVRCWDWPWK